MKKYLKFSSLIIFLLLLLFPVLARDNNPNLPPYDNDLLWERDFNDTTCFPWHNTEDSGGVCKFEVVDVNPDPQVYDGAFRLEVIDIGENRWSTQFRHRGITLEQGHTYTVKFKIWSDIGTSVYAKIGMMGDPFTEYWNNNWKEWSLSPGKVVEVEQTFTMTSPTDQTCEFTFHCGGPLGTAGAEPYYIYLDDASLYDEEFVKVYPEILEQPDVRVNQLGYFPEGSKKATVISDATVPIEWRLLNAAGATKAVGMTNVFGFDKDSQEYVHKIDFSDFQTEGTGYRFFIPDSTSKLNYSHNFDIRDDLYSQMKLDALQYFYHNRSGIAIEMPYAGREDLTRAAGHIDVAPNKGDSAVATWPDSGQKNYSLDVKGGWYDAGDHGKYVVNGGISVWTMMNQWERAVIKGIDGLAPYCDGGMNIPEAGNGIPDILDESRWQMEFMLKMQVPADKDPDLAGMVHHKIHDDSWTAIPMRPADDPKTRYLRPVSTAATLNLAATAAQTARIWSDRDPVFAAKSLEAAEKAWKAALAHPDIFAPLHNLHGGGPYNDTFVDDEFYWAACELFITTGKAEYKTYIENSQFYLQMPWQLGNAVDNGLIGAFTWGTTQGLGTVSLALLPNDLSAADKKQAQDNMAGASDQWLNIIDGQGFGLPIKQGGPNADEGYPWGSNSFIVNIMIVMAYAYDFTGETKYLNGMKESMDYLMGRNSLDQSYVTGYGERKLENPHHRFWAYQFSSEYPKPPAGCFSGGPNSHFQDPTINAAVKKDTPVQKVFIDHIDSWSTNEITINWNAPFAWVTCYLDEFAETEKVRITSPAAGTKYEVGANIKINAQVTTMESIKQVKFYNESSLLGIDTSFPYSYTITNASAGAYELTAVVECVNGKVLTSPITPVLVKEIVKPTATLIKPEMGFICHAEEIIVLTASAADSDGVIKSVYFKIGTEEFKAKYDESDGLYKYNWKSVEGAHTICAYSIDDDGAVSLDSNKVDVLIKPAKNLVVQYGCRESGASVSTVRGKLNIINKGTKPYSLEGVVVRYYWTNDYPGKSLNFACHHAQNIGSGNVKAVFGSTAEYDFLELSFGNYQIPGVSETGEVQFDFHYNDYTPMLQSDDYSYDGTISDFTQYEKMTLYKNGELLWGTPPVVEPYLNISLASPADGTVLTEGIDNTINISAVIDTNIASVSPVSFYNGTQLLGTDNSAPYTYSIENAAIGTYAIKAEVTAEGNTYSSNVATVKVIEYVEVLEIAITSPAPNSVIALGDSVSITADVNTNVTGSPVVSFYYNTVKIAEDMSAPYSASFTPTAAGPGTIEAKVEVGQLNALDTVNIEVKELIKPTVVITSPLEGATYDAGQSVIITADSHDPDGTVVSVQFFVDGSVISSDVWTAAGNGSHVITAVATDNDGLSTTSAPITIYVNDSGKIDLKFDGDVWGSGFSGNVIITNNTATTINGWTVTINWKNGEVITNAWNAVGSQTGSTATYSNLDWNAVIEPGQSQSFGFQGTHNGTFKFPSDATVTPKN